MSCQMGPDDQQSEYTCVSHQNTLNIPPRLVYGNGNIPHPVMYPHNTNGDSSGYEYDTNLGHDASAYSFGNVPQTPINQQHGPMYHQEYPQSPGNPVDRSNNCGDYMQFHDYAGAGYPNVYPNYHYLEYLQNLRLYQGNGYEHIDPEPTAQPLEFTEPSVITHETNDDVGTDSDEDLDEEESDGSNTDALIDHLEATFNNVLDQKIQVTEAFFDNHEYAVTAHSISKLSSINFPEKEEIRTSNESKNENIKVSSKNVSTEITNKVIVENCNLGEKFSSCVLEDSRNSLQPPSGLKVRCKSDSQIHYRFTPKVSSTEDLVSPLKTSPNNARKEIVELRLAKESLTAKRIEVADKMKQSEITEASDEKRLYEYEEAIEAIDLAMEYRNEIICGHDSTLSDDVDHEKSETNLLSRLANLSLLDLQRILCKYFAKVVELRFSTTRLEKGIEALENDTEQLYRQLLKDQNHIKEIQLEYESRIKLIIRLYSKDSNSALENYLRQLDKSLAAAIKKQYDLERALTELLVRHGYLHNGADYDVKQVVKMLGIDTVQMGLNWRDGGKKKTASIPAKVRTALESAAVGGQGMSRRMKEAFAQRRPAQSQIATFQPPHQAPYPSTSRHHHHHYQYNHYNPHLQHREPEAENVTPPVVAEVRREKRKIIIHPSLPAQHQQPSHHNQQHHHNSYSQQNNHY